MTKYRYYTFTLNNYTPNDVDKLQSLPKGCVYLIYGKEVGLSGTPHLQGVICFSGPRSPSSVNLIFGGKAHTEPARRLAKAIEYCKKDGDFTELGSSPDLKGQGKRSDLHALRDAINEGETDRKKLRQEFPDVCAKYPGFVSSLIIDNLPSPSVESFPLRVWQAQLYSALALAPDPRTIFFIVDKKGNSGKTWFTKYYRKLNPEKTLILSPGKKADMTYALVEQLTAATRVIFFDAPRCKQQDIIQYDFLEELKNGFIFNQKYQSRVVEFPPPHVVVMMNEHPDEKKLSSDRFVIDEIDDRRNLPN